MIKFKNNINKLLEFLQIAASLKDSLKCIATYYSFLLTHNYRGITVSIMIFTNCIIMKILDIRKHTKHLTERLNNNHINHIFILQVFILQV